MRLFQNNFVSKFLIKVTSLAVLVISIGACGDSISKKEYKSPEIIWGELFIDVANASIFENTKIFADALPKFPKEEIIEKYKIEKKKTGFNLKSFVLENFKIEQKPENIEASSLEDFITKFETINRKSPDDDGGSLFPTRKNYMAGGNLFQENSYWNSYFVMLGLHATDSLLTYNVINAAQFIQDFGHVPEGNRSYLINRSGTPMLSLMVEMLAEKKHSNNAQLQSISQLTKEYQYWMAAENGDEIENQNKSKKLGRYKKVVFLPDNNILNRYFVSDSLPRTCYYSADIALAKGKQNATEVYRNLQTLSESNWPISRFDKQLNCVEILPLDLNALLYHYEKTLAKAYKLKGQNEYFKSFEALAAKRKAIYNRYFWNETKGFYFDYNFKTKTQNSSKTLAALMPLVVGLADNNQAEKVLAALKSEFLRPYGLADISTESVGSAQMNSLAYLAAKKYNFQDFASDIKTRWISANRQYFEKHKTISENYNVAEIEKPMPQNRQDGAVGILKFMMEQK